MNAHVYMYRCIVSFHVVRRYNASKGVYEYCGSQLSNIFVNVQICIVSHLYHDCILTINRSYLRLTIQPPNTRAIQKGRIG